MKNEQNEKNQPSGQQNQDNVPYSFIQQEVIPKKKRGRVEKFFMMVLVTVLLAVIFGLVSFLVYQTADRLFGTEPEKQYEREKVTLGSETTTAQQPEETTEDAETTTEATSEEILPGQEEDQLQEYRQHYEALRDIADEVNQSLVTVIGVTNGLDWFLNDSEKTNSTCGLIMAENGEELLILTEYDEIEDSNEIRITFRDSTTVVGQYYDGDKETGLALVAVTLNELSSETVATYKIAQLGESYELEAGMPIIALGNPNGYMYSMLTGMVTNRRTEQYITDNKIELFNTNLPVNSNGEGVIVDLDGRIVGLMSHQFNSDLNKNISTCLSISRVRTLLENMANQEKRPYFGIVGSELTTEAAESLGTGSGIYVTSIDSKSPAFEAGILRGDIITAVNGTPISGFVSFQSAIRAAGAGHEVQVSIVRTTKTSDNVMTIPVELGVRK